MKLYLLLALGTLTAASASPASAAETDSASARIVSGSIRSDGTVTSGSRFSVLRIDNGQYRITFTPAFSETPAVVGSQNNFGSTDEATNDTIVFPSVDATGAVALTGNNGGNKENRSFAFMARGR